MLWLGVNLTAVIPCSGVSQLLIFVICKSLARIVTNTTKYSHITPVRKTLRWLPIEHHSIFKTALLVYKFLHSGYPKYFVPFLKPRHSVYNTNKCQSGCVFLSFPYDAPKIWNDLPDDAHSATSVHSLRKKLKTYIFAQAYPP